MFKIIGIDHVVLRVTNVQRMLDFYVGVLGCTMEKVQAASGLYQLRAGRSLIDLVPVDGAIGKLGGAAPGKEGRNLDHLCLRVQVGNDGAFDGKALRAYLIQKGAQPGIVESRYGAEGQGPSVYVSDPEGNVVELKGPAQAQLRPAVVR
jgi:glyoxylase I family protein